MLVEKIKRGQVIVQTYNLEHYAVQCGIQQDYNHFYNEEILLRKAMYYPPFCQLIKLIIQDENEENALTKAQNLKNSSKINSKIIKILLSWACSIFNRKFQGNVSL